jgi:hypothetical protein
MKIGRQLNTFSHGEYLHLLQHYRQFSDFNTLGLFRSLLENHRLSLSQRLELRQAAIAAFPKQFDFLQLKDPLTYFKLSILGEELTDADREQAWDNIRHNQQRILNSKRLRHRNFGTYSKHLCGHDNCPLNGLMTKDGSCLSYPSYPNMPFASDRKRFQPWRKSEAWRRERKSSQRIIAQELADDRQK